MNREIKKKLRLIQKKFDNKTVLLWLNELIIKNERIFTGWGTNVGEDRVLEFPYIFMNDKSYETTIIGDNLSEYKIQLLTIPIEKNYTISMKITRENTDVFIGFLTTDILSSAHLKEFNLNNMQDLPGSYFILNSNGLIYSTGNPVSYWSDDDVEKYGYNNSFTSGSIITLKEERNNMLKFAKNDLTYNHIEEFGAKFLNNAFRKILVFGIVNKGQATFKFVKEPDRPKFPRLPNNLPLENYYSNLTTNDGGVRNRISNYRYSKTFFIVCKVKTTPLVSQYLGVVDNLINNNSSNPYSSFPSIVFDFLKKNIIISSVDFQNKLDFFDYGETVINLVGNYNKFVLQINGMAPFYFSASNFTEPHRYFMVGSELNNEMMISEFGVPFVQDFNPLNFVFQNGLDSINFTRGDLNQFSVYNSNQPFDLYTSVIKFSILNFNGPDIWIGVCDDFKNNGISLPTKEEALFLNNETQKKVNFTYFSLEQFLDNNFTAQQMSRVTFPICVKIYRSSIDSGIYVMFGEETPIKISTISAPWYYFSVLINRSTSSLELNNTYITPASTVAVTEDLFFTYANPTVLTLPQFPSNFGDIVVITANQKFQRDFRISFKFTDIQSALYIGFSNEKFNTSKKTYTIEEFDNLNLSYINTGDNSIRIQNIITGFFSGNSTVETSDDMGFDTFFNHQDGILTIIASEVLRVRADNTSEVSSVLGTENYFFIAYEGTNIGTVSIINEPPAEFNTPMYLENGSFNQNIESIPLSKSSLLGLAGESLQFIVAPSKIPINKGIGIKIIRSSSLDDLVIGFVGSLEISRLYQNGLLKPYNLYDDENSNGVLFNYENMLFKTGVSKYVFNFDDFKDNLSVFGNLTNDDILNFMFTEKGGKLELLLGTNGNYALSHLTNFDWTEEFYFMIAKNTVDYVELESVNVPTPTLSTEVPLMFNYKPSMIFSFDYDNASTFNQALGYISNQELGEFKFKIKKSNFVSNNSFMNQFIGITNGVHSFRWIFTSMQFVIYHIIRDELEVDLIEEHKIEGSSVLDDSYLGFFIKDSIVSLYFDSETSAAFEFNINPVSINNKFKLAMVLERYYVPIGFNITEFEPQLTSPIISQVDVANRELFFEGTGNANWIADSMGSYYNNDTDPKYNPLNKIAISMHTYNISVNNNPYDATKLRSTFATSSFYVRSMTSGMSNGSLSFIVTNSNIFFNQNRSGYFSSLVFAYYNEENYQNSFLTLMNYFIEETGFILSDNEFIMQVDFMPNLKITTFVRSEERFSDDNLNVCKLKIKSEVPFPLPFNFTIDRVGTASTSKKYSLVRDQSGIWMYFGEFDHETKEDKDEYDILKWIKIASVSYTTDLYGMFAGIQDPNGTSVTNQFYPSESTLKRNNIY